MNSFYKNIGLYEYQTFEIEMNKSEFLEHLKKITYKTNSSFISFIPDHGIPTRFEYRGFVTKDNFIIKRRKRFFDYNIFPSIIKGVISEKNNVTLIKIEFTPFSIHLLPLVLAPLLFLLIAIFEIRNEENYFMIAVPIILAVSQYFILKKNIKRDKYDFERELNFIVRKSNQLKR
ncbi:hypothetical protein CHRY9390_00278 [Chryseobacterium aquaeductus]|uniref:Uncharacterized protein n=1 Tax=Chryseobacterium aquaeductus TaxID=2675056 RepID=A0A9N8QT68_9FLAO|nr:hypothetical protein [Chryseobacterium aquaeductus]CAA7329638.1 hypothetical protein CHRY9390_00278 [Chryseobacterium potabilaquae]CAD7798084.1 hypothetical protein CHRY9390_00278 [Chryseobacterium aquaeductus]